MSTYEEALCNNTTDLEFVIPDIQQFDRKIVLSGWLVYGSNIYYAGSTGTVDTLFRDQFDLGDAEANLGALTEDGEWFYDSDTDVCYLYSLNNPLTHHTMEGGRNFTNLKNEAINRATEFVRSYINKPIYKRTGTGVQSPTARDYEDVVIRGTAILAASMMLMPYDPDRAMTLEKLVFDREEGTGYLDMIKRGEIRLWHEVDKRLSEGVVHPVSLNSSTTGSIIDVKGRGTRSDVIMVKITTPTSGNATIAAGTASTVKFSTWVGDDTGLKVVAQEADRVVSGGYDSIGLGMYAKFSMGVYYVNDEWEIQVAAHSDYPETQLQVKNTQAERYGTERIT